MNDQVSPAVAGFDGVKITTTKGRAMNWVRTYENGIDFIESIDGVEWSDAPLPRRWHRCHVQTRGWMGVSYVERCPCGATRLGPRDPWMEKNQTRQHRARKRRDEKAPKETVTCALCGTPYEAVAGSGMARERMCSSCWADNLVRACGHADYNPRAL